eukprot:588816-Pelagomonas_calceolata.AAC.4
MAEVLSLTNHRVFSLHLCCNGVLLRQGLEITTDHPRQVRPGRAQAEARLAGNHQGQLGPLDPCSVHQLQVCAPQLDEWVKAARKGSGVG